MLQYLRISNLALLDKVTLEFEPGLTVVTGETGAGKSVLLGALSLLAGARTDKSVIRQGAGSCEIEASLFFSNPSRINAILETLNLPCCEDNTLILRRLIDREKSPRIQVNGSLAPLSALGVLSEYWIDFHGPGEPQKLFHHQYQLQMLDMYAGLTPLMKDYSDLYGSWKKLLKEAVELSQKERLSEDELAFYQSQVDKINAINPSEESINELEKNFSRISHAQEIALICEQLESGLRGECGAVPGIQSLIRPAHELSKMIPSTHILAERLNSLIIEAEDIASEYSSLNEDVDNDPEFIHNQHQQMNNWLEISRQYGPSIEAVLKKRRALEEKIASQSNIEARLDKLNDEACLKKDSLEKLAKILEQKRRECAETLSKKVQELLQLLGFQKAKLEINICSEDTLKEYGNCFAEFVFAPNAGQELMPLNKIASSGETARVMLALKTILAEVDQTPVLVFDEVDANVGGEIASKVASELKNLSKNHQVFCVTHLPQAAAQAHNHYVVNKKITGGATTVSILKLSDSKERARELARMLGDRSSESALNHAMELLNQPSF